MSWHFFEHLVCYWSQFLNLGILLRPWSLFLITTYKPLKNLLELLFFHLQADPRVFIEQQDSLSIYQQNKSKESKPNFFKHATTDIIQRKTESDFFKYATTELNKGNHIWIP